MRGLSLAAAFAAIGFAGCVASSENQPMPESAGLGGPTLAGGSPMVSGPQSVLLGQQASDEARKLLLDHGQYTIRPGDTAMKVSLLFGIELSELSARNPGVDWSKIRIGQKIVVEPAP